MWKVKDSNLWNPLGIQHLSRMPLSATQPTFQKKEEVISELYYVSMNQYDHPLIVTAIRGLHLLSVVLIKPVSLIFNVSHR